MYAFFELLESRDVPAKIHPFDYYSSTNNNRYVHMCKCVCVCTFYIYAYIGIYLNIENLIYNLHLGVLSLSGGLLTIIIKHVTRYVFFFYTAYIIV